MSVDTSVTVTFSAAIPDGGTWSVDIADVDGTATLSDDGMSATFVPDATLPFETAFTVTATACDDTQTAEFATRPQPVDPAVIDGMTYGISEDELNVTVPSRLGGILGLAGLELFNVIALQLSNYDDQANTFQVSSTILDADSTPVCDFLISVPTDFSTNPLVVFGPEDLLVDLGFGPLLTLEDLMVRARAASDGSELTDVEVSLAIALEKIPLPGGNSSLEAYLVGDALAPCGDSSMAAAALSHAVGGITCVPCDSSDSGMCMLVEADATRAGSVSVDLEQECASK